MGGRGGVLDGGMHGAAPWAPLHLRSDRSLAFGTASPAELVRRLSEDRIPAAALTDVEGTHAQVAFQVLCEDAGIRPVAGVELRARDAGATLARGGATRASRAVLLARGPGGYERICRVVTVRRDAVDAERCSPRSGPDEIVAALEHVGADELFVLTDDPRLARALVSRGVAPPDALRLLLVRPRPRWPERDVRAAAEALAVPLLADPDPVFLEPEDHALHRLLRAVGERRILGDPELERGVEAPERHLPRPAEVAARYADVPDALAETLRVASACDVRLSGSAPGLPAPPGLDRATADAMLARRVRTELDGARLGGRCSGEAYDARVERELSVLAARGLSGAFLIVAEVVERGRRERVPVAARGSAVGSLVGHLLGFSGVDPVEAGLHFERFVHRRRRGLPDIDLDVGSRGREGLIAWMHDRFGHDRVALASTVHTFQRRSAWREGLRAAGVPQAEADRVLDRMAPEDEWAELEAAGAQPHTGEPPAAVLRRLPPHLPRLIRRMVGRPRHVALHPGGVVVAPFPLVRLAPTEAVGVGIRMVQLDADALEVVGLMKLDLLGSRGLTEMEVAVSHLPATGELPSIARALADGGLDAIPKGDERTLRLLDEADTVGIGQVETPAVRAVLEQVPVRSLADLTAGLAVVRPGAAAGQAKRRFVRSARGERGPSARPSPAPFEEALAETHGVLLYEEDVMRVLAQSAGIDLEEADEIRRTLVDLQSVAGAEPHLERLERDFLARAAQRGLARAEAAATWSEVARLAAYSFNKAHASSYALLAYRSAFLRRHAPLAFACGVLDHHGGAYPMRTVAAAIERWGVRVLAPDVSRSEVDTMPLEGAALLGLSHVASLGARTIRRILAARAARPFADLADFRVRARPAARELEALMMVGACDGLDPLDAAAYPFAHWRALGDSGALAPRDDVAFPRSADAAALPQDARTPSGREAVEASPEETRLRRYGDLVRVREELRFLRMHPSAHPMAILRPDAETLGCSDLRDARAAPEGPVRVAALLAAARRVLTPAGMLRFVTLEDETGLLEAVLSPSVQAEQGHRVSTPGPYLVEGQLRDDLGHRWLEVRSIRPFHERGAPGR